MEAKEHGAFGEPQSRRRHLSWPEIVRDLVLYTMLRSAKKYQGVFLS